MDEERNASSADEVANFRRLVLLSTKFGQNTAQLYAHPNASKWHEVWVEMVDDLRMSN